MKKAISALNTMTAAQKIHETDWILTTAYYARYFALYALLMKMGVKSEIHDCTINMAKLLAIHGVLAVGLVEDIAEAKQTRIDTQYYVEQEQDSKIVLSSPHAARKFVLETEKIIENLTPQQANIIRENLRKLQKKS